MNSIRASLAIMLIAAFSLVTFLAALNGYRSSMAEAEQLLDAQLSYASDMLLLAAEATTGTDDSLVDSLESEDEFAFQLWWNGRLVRRSAGAPESPIHELMPGFRYANFSGYRWRTLTRMAEDSRICVVAERADMRHAVAEKVVLESVLPLLLWLPVSAALVWVLVGWGLRPLASLSTQLNLRRGDDLQPIDCRHSPAELLPLIDSTNSLLSRLEDSFEREKHFASHAAHELRTPLSVVKVHLHNLAMELPPENNSLAHANAGVARMHHLVEQILDLSRTNPEIIQGNFQSLDLHTLVQNTTASAWPEFAERQQNLSLHGDSVSMAGDPVMLEILVQNLLNNARKYTPRGGEIQVSVKPLDERARLQVADSGPGILPFQREQVFERFFRSGDAVRGVAGSGLGLAIVQQISLAHGARIELAESELGGLLVTVDFPLSREQG